MKKGFVLFLLISFFLPFFANAQKEQKTDSLKKIIAATKDPKKKLDAQADLAKLYYEFRNPSAKALYEEVYSNASKISYYPVWAKATEMLGVLSFEAVKFNEALEYFKKASVLDSISKNEVRFATDKSKMASVYEGMGKYSQALKLYFDAIKILERLNAEEDLPFTYQNTGTVFLRTKKNEKAIEYYEKAAVLFKKQGKMRFVASCYNNLGIVHKNLKQYDKALDEYKNAYEIRKDLNDKRGLAATFNGMGTVYAEQGNDSAALRTFLKVAAIREEIKDIIGMAIAYGNISSVTAKLKKYDQALEYNKKAYEIASKNKLNELLQEIYLGYANIYAAMGDYKNAYDYKELNTRTKDSILGAESMKQMNELQTQYETEKKEQQIKLLNKDKELDRLLLTQKNIEIYKNHLEGERKTKEIELLNKESELQEVVLQKEKAEKETQHKQFVTENKAKEQELDHQKTLRNTFIAGFALVAVLAIIAFRNYRLKQRSNIELANKNEEIKKQKHIVEEKQKEILDSINYAKRIQSSLLPNDKFVEKELKRLSKNN